MAIGEAVDAQFQILDPLEPLLHRQSEEAATLVDVMATCAVETTEIPLLLITGGAHQHLRLQPGSDWLRVDTGLLAFLLQVLQNATAIQQKVNHFTPLHRTLADHVGLESLVRVTIETGSDNVD